MVLEFVGDVEDGGGVGFGEGGVGGGGREEGVFFFHFHPWWGWGEPEWGLEGERCLVLVRGCLLLSFPYLLWGGVGVNGGFE
ncbi:hypothetical protein Leryth_012676 [Lithospermum erythrorhizon]|nr:hypothetical protein Leryth_012676 [Lithospermum erythrorhizon]